MFRQSEKSYKSSSKSALSSKSLEEKEDKEAYEKRESQIQVQGSLESRNQELLLRKKQRMAEAEVICRYEKKIGIHFFLIFLERTIRK